MTAPKITTAGHGHCARRQPPQVEVTQRDIEERRPTRTVSRLVALRDGPLWAWVFGRPMYGGAAPGMTWADRAWWRLRRAGWRHGGLCGVVCLLVEAVTDPAGALIVLAAAALSGVFLGWQWWRARPHYREFTVPLHHRLREAGVPVHGYPPEKHLHIPPDRDNITFHLPHGWHAPEKALAAVEEAIAHACGLGAGYQVTRQLTGRKRHVVLAKPPLWPGEVGLAAIIGDIEAADPWHIVLGRGRGDQVVGFKIVGSGANPHGLINGPSTTAGKSTTAKLICAQWMKHGGVTIICDVASLSHPWAHTYIDGGAPNAVVLRTVEEIAEALIWLRGEMDRRVGVGVYAQRRSGAIEADLGVHILLLLEEMVSLMADLKDYPEAVEALVKLVVRGRHMRIHCALLAQRAKARTLAGKYGGQVRENLGWGLFGVGTTPATLKFTAEGLPWPPGGVKGGQGRYGLVLGREWIDVQIAYLSNEEAFQLATSGTVAALPAGFPAPDAVTDGRRRSLPPGETQPQPVTTTTPPPVPGDRLVSLRVRLPPRTAEPRRVAGPGEPRPVAGPHMPAARIHRRDRETVVGIRTGRIHHLRTRHHRKDKSDEQDTSYPQPVAVARRQQAQHPHRCICAARWRFPYRRKQTLPLVIRLCTPTPGAGRRTGMNQAAAPGPAHLRPDRDLGTRLRATWRAHPKLLAVAAVICLLSVPGGAMLLAAAGGKAKPPPPPAQPLNLVPPPNLPGTPSLSPPPSPSATPAMPAAPPGTPKPGNPAKPGKLKPMRPVALPGGGMAPPLTAPVAAAAPVPAPVKPVKVKTVKAVKAPKVKKAKAAKALKTAAPAVAAAAPAAVAAAPAAPTTAPAAVAAPVTPTVAPVAAAPTVTVTAAAPAPPLIQAPAAAPAAPAMTVAAPPIVAAPAPPRPPIPVPVAVSAARPSCTPKTPAIGGPVTAAPSPSPSPTTCP